MFKKLVATALGGCLLVAALCLDLMPATALAVEGAPNLLYVGNQQVISSSDTTYWTANNSGELERVEGASDTSNNWNVKYDPNSNTLTLRGASIQGGSNAVSAPYGSGIYALSHSGQPVSLTIKLIGENTITGSYGIYVNSDLSANSYGTDASLTITGESNGSLKVSGSSLGICVISGTGDASLTIKNASVDANTTQTNSGYAGVYVQSSPYATSSPQLSLAVNGGSLTASGGDGISFNVGSSDDIGATTSLTISDNAIVRAENGIKASRVDEPTPSGTGIVFNDKKGTVYGDVTLDESLTIGEDETLTIPEGSTLNTNGNLTNNGTIVNTGGTLNGELGGTGKIETTPTIDTQPASQTVTKGNTATFTVAATGENLSYQWQLSTDNGQNWTDIGGATGVSYTTEATTISMSGYQYRCVVSNSAGSVTSSAATLAVNEHVHEWVVAWSWDGTKATATFTCKNDGSHQATEDAAVTSAVKTPAACTETGVTTYTATVEFGGETYTSTKDVADIPATGHEFEGGLCSVCGARDASFSPALVSGDGAKWTKGSSKGLTFVSSAAFADLVEVRLDGRVLSASEYAVREGSTVVTIPAKLLEGLKAGDHELLIVSGSGTVRASLTVAEAAKVEEAAKTEKASADELPASGDSTAPALAVAVAAAAGAGLVLLSRRRAAR